MEWNLLWYALFRSLFMSQNHRWPSHLKFVKTIENPSLSMVNLRKSIQWWWSSGSKTIKKPSKAMVPRKKIITIPSSWKHYHRWSLNCTLLQIFVKQEYYLCLGQMYLKDKCVKMRIKLQNYSSMMLVLRKGQIYISGMKHFCELCKTQALTYVVGFQNSRPF